MALLSNLEVVKQVSESVEGYSDLDTRLDFIQENTNTTISTDFDFNDILLANKLIGLVPANKRIERVDLIINSSFENNVSIKVGDNIFNDKLMKSSDNDPSINDTYINNIGIIYNNETEIYVYFGGTSSIGSGRIIIYL